MSISRRGFSLAVAGAPFILRSQSGPVRARVKIDTERVIGEIDPKIYGNFIEHLGRCIDGGVFEEKSPLSDANGFRRDVLDAAKKLNVSILRWPGGNFSSNYNWRDGIGPRNLRPPRLEMAWGTVESNRFGTHEFLDYAQAVGAQPYICCNLGTGTWTDAQQWVEYCNSAEDTAMTRLRKAKIYQLMIEMGKTVQSIEIRLGHIENKLSQMGETDERSRAALHKAEDALERVRKLEEQQNWLWRTLIGSIITAAVGALFYFGR